MLLGLLAFLCVSLGGMAIGFACGFASAFITKYTNHVRGKSYFDYHMYAFSKCTQFCCSRRAGRSVRSRLSIVHSRRTISFLRYNRVCYVIMNMHLTHRLCICRIICCGLNQAQFACVNISPKSYISVNYFAKVGWYVFDCFFSSNAYVNIVR